VCLATLLPGDVLVFNGSLNGRNKRLAHHALEPLEDSLFEILNVPSWWLTWNEYLVTYNPKAVSIEQNGDYGWQLTLETKSGEKHFFWFNPTHEQTACPDGKVLFKDNDDFHIVSPGGFLVTEA
jgi:hypothetical protein